MIRKTLLALAATAVSMGGLAATSSSASANNYYFNTGYGHQQTYIAQPSYESQISYRTISTPVYKTVQYFDNYLCRWVSRQVLDHYNYALYAVQKVWNSYTCQWEWKQTFVRYVAQAY